ncbi:unnamed protein product [Alopecurus aequalis]
MGRGPVLLPSSLSPCCRRSPSRRRGDDSGGPGGGRGGATRGAPPSPPRHVSSTSLAPSPNAAAHRSPLLPFVPGMATATSSGSSPFSSALTGLAPDRDGGGYYSLPALGDPRIDKLPYTIRVLLESGVRNCDEFQITKEDVEKIMGWEKTSLEQVEIPFKPSRVILQDFTGVPVLVDLASMRDAMSELGGNPDKINPMVPADLVIDHSVTANVVRSDNAVQANMELEFERNKERFAFLKWASSAFHNMLIIPPGSGIVHQVNLEYLARVVFSRDGIFYPDSVLGTDSHTTMINGLGVLGWGVGGIDAEAAMLGQPMSMVLPGVVGFKLHGTLSNGVTATYLVLTVTQMLRKHGVVGKFVEFYGRGMEELALPDRATIANMAPEYGATVGFFPVDHITLEYLKMTGREDETVSTIEAYLRANKMLVDYNEPTIESTYSSYLELDLRDVEPCISGPKRPHDRVTLRDVKADWHTCLENKIGFKGYGIPKDLQDRVVKFDFHGQTAELKHGTVVVAAITSCTNTSNPTVMISSGLVAKKACELGLEVKPWIKTSLAPGSGVVTKYLLRSGLLKYVSDLGFSLVGYGCTTCIGNSGDLDQTVADAITENDIIAAAVLSGNRNFEGRIHPLTQANYLASPPLVVVYALAGTVDINFEEEPIGTGKDERPIFLRDIWPSTEEVSERYKSDGQDTILLAGSEYGTGSSRDWDAKGTMLLGVKAVIAKSFERIHRSNLVGMGVIPLCFKSGEDVESIGLTGHEQYTIHLPSSVHEMRPGQDIVVTTSTGKSFTCTLRFDTEVELSYFDHGWILHYVARKLVNAAC